jgi:poly(A) polymerase Pap1
MKMQSQQLMSNFFYLLESWKWPLAFILSMFFVSRALIVVARIGIRVEIFTRLPILIGTGSKPIQAEVEKVRI